MSNFSLGEIDQQNGLSTEDYITLYRGNFARQEPCFAVGEVAMYVHPRNGSFMLCKVYSFKIDQHGILYEIILEPLNRIVKSREGFLNKISNEDAERYREKVKKRAERRFIMMVGRF